MKNVSETEDLELEYAVYYRAHELPVQPRELTSQERHARQARYDRRRAAPCLHGSMQRRSARHVAG